MFRISGTPTAICTTQTGYGQVAARSLLRQTCCFPREKLRLHHPSLVESKLCSRVRSVEAR